MSTMVDHEPREPAMPAPSPSPTREVARITRPLVALVLLVVGLSAPLAYLILAQASERRAAHASAKEIAGQLSREAAERPELWRYDTPKLLRHLWVYRRQPDVAAIRVVDSQGIVVDFADAAERRAAVVLAWEHAPIVADGRRVGSAWVAANLARVHQNAFYLAVGFALLGLLLAAALYRFPLATLAFVERRLVESKDALRRLNATLEDQVRERSAELHRANAALRANQERLRLMSRRAIAVQEDERRAIARDLHDGAGQTLTAMRIELELLHGAADPAAMRRHAERAAAISDSVMEDFRRALAQLAPAVLDEVGLEGALERLLTNVREQTRIETALDAELPEALALGEAVKVAVYRVVQEAVTNAVRHAAPRQLRVRVRQRDASIEVTVEDDGSGFTPTPNGASGHGLRGMRERVELLGGEFSVRSAPGAGTTLQITLPLASRAAEPETALKPETDVEAEPA